MQFSRENRPINFGKLAKLSGWNKKHGPTPQQNGANFFCKFTCPAQIIYTAKKMRQTQARFSSSIIPCLPCFSLFPVVSCCFQRLFASSVDGLARDFDEKLVSRRSKRGPSKPGLGPKDADSAKKGPFGAISALTPVLRCRGIGPDRLRKGPNQP